jgi:hypothetical protein
MRTIPVICFKCKKVFNRAITGIVTIADLQSVESTCWDCNKELHQMYASAEATKMGLESLAGTEKQVIWANPIRFKVLTELITRLHDKWESRDQFEIARTRLVHVLNIDPLLHNAAWWIAHRYNEYGIKSYIVKQAVHSFQAG